MEKIALITGANKGIGFETARQLGRLGMTVLIGARSPELGEDAAKALRDEGIDARSIVIDVTRDDLVQAAADRIESEFGRLDVLVNNAGISTAGYGRLIPSETPVEAIQAVHAVNLYGPIRVTNAMLPLLQKAEAARVVNVSSEIGSIGTQSNPASPIYSTGASLSYTTSKAALNMATAMYAKQFHDTPMKFNAANPGFTATDFTSYRGIRSAAQGAEPSVYLATLPADGPTGVLYGHIWTTEGDGDGGYGVLPW